MANELLKTLTIDGVSNDALGVGKYLALDSSNKVEIPVVWTEGIKTVTLANGSQTNYEMITLPETGLYFFVYVVEFPTNATGARFSSAYSITGSLGMGGSQRTAPSPSGQTYHSAFCMSKRSAGEKVGLRLFQNSGTNFTNNVKLSMWAHYIPE